MARQHFPKSSRLKYKRYHLFFSPPSFLICNLNVLHLLLQVFFALTISAMGVSQASALAPDSSKAKDSAASIFAILDSKPNIDSSSSKGVTLGTVTGNIEFDHVSFKYPTRPDIQIFRDLCLSIPSGKVKQH